MRLLISAAIAIGMWATSANAASAKGDFLVKVTPAQLNNLEAMKSQYPAGTKIENLGVNGWVRVQMPANVSTVLSTNSILGQKGVLAVEPNRIIKLQANWQVKDKAIRAALKKQLADDGGLPFPGGGDAAADNPPIPANGTGGSGADPLYAKQWGMNQNGVRESWSATKGAANMIVAVIDTGVDYTHEDLSENLWRNPGETGKDAGGKDKASNGVDDDNNGFIDDVIGWDFVTKDNKPYDLAASLFDMLLSGGNPGHGTHCAGNVAARGDNGKGITGVAPNVKIMVLRFISEKGQGTTADAIASVKYGVDNGAKVLSNSWGSEGDDGGAESQALKDVINYAKDRNVLFIAAAGNGHQGKGYDNDTDAKPAYPASYAIDNIVSVAAINEGGTLGSFSNWGARTVHIGAPGVKVFSTTVGGKYDDTVINLPQLGIVATWDGTSMACPHVAGAAALYWSKHPEMTYSQVKQAIIDSAKANPNLNGKMISHGQLDVRNLMNR